MGSICFVMTYHVASVLRGCFCLSLYTLKQIFYLRKSLMVKRDVFQHVIVVMRIVCYMVALSISFVTCNDRLSCLMLGTKWPVLGIVLADTFGFDFFSNVLKLTIFIVCTVKYISSGNTPPGHVDDCCPGSKDKEENLKI